MAPEKPETLRCFIAVLLSDEIREKAVKVEEKLRSTNADVKWVEAENLHITLRFLGNITEELLEEIKAIMNEAKENFPPTKVRLKGVGGFPDSRRPRVIWIGGEEGHLARLASFLEERIVKLGIPPEKPFKLHLTLGRVRSPRGVDKLSRMMRELEDIEIGEMEVEKISLMQSTLSPSGPRYSVLYEVHLGR